jgi:hypothetical protein
MPLHSSPAIRLLLATAAWGLSFLTAKAFRPDKKSSSPKHLGRCCPKLPWARRAQCLPPVGAFEALRRDGAWESEVRSQLVSGYNEVRARSPRVA